jgi:hypothetical protein
VSQTTAALFTNFADWEARGVSPLYERLARAVALRPALLSMLDAVAPAQQRATLFFAAVHDVVLEQRVKYPADGASLEAFCGANADAILDRIANRRTQTNEVARCAQLLPALAIIAALAGRMPSLLEVGASAGLNLRFDDYRYTYRAIDRAIEVGDVRAGVHVDCAFEGDARIIPTAMPEVGDRIGLDLHPIDLDDPTEARWLRACVWPEEVDRDRRLQAAIASAKADPPTVITGDAVNDLQAVAARIPAQSPLIVMHQALTPYLPERSRTSLRRAIHHLARSRPVYWLFAEAPTAAETLVGFAPTFTNGIAYHALVLTDLTRKTLTPVALAVADPHGRWLRWLAPSDCDPGNGDYLAGRN